MIFFQCIFLWVTDRLRFSSSRVYLLTNSYNFGICFKNVWYIQMYEVQKMLLKMFQSSRFEKTDQDLV